MNMIIEPSSATVIAAILEYPEVFAGKKVGLILSGGNIDPGLFPHLAAETGD
jgi:threonine dehydratase